MPSRARVDSETRTGFSDRSSRRRQKAFGQHTLDLSNVSCRSLHSVPPRKSVHPPNKPSTTYKITNPPPDRVYCTVKRTPYGGETLVPDPFNEWWDTGEHYNRESNIRALSFAECRRKAAQAAHDVHRCDQINHERLAADRDNLVNTFKVWPPPRHASPNQSRDPGYTWYPPKPGAAQASCGVHNARDRACSEYRYCFDGEGVRPSAIYTRKYQRVGEAAFRQRNLWEIKDPAAETR